ncbi:MAG: hypothetical protein GYA24_07060 [Candidatus Lokiarchaeota archaeon]|nr:hypothetical protein [Candidatus Lokiarchaeota archaeon]
MGSRGKLETTLDNLLDEHEHRAVPLPTLEDIMTAPRAGSASRYCDEIKRVYRLLRDDEPDVEFVPALFGEKAPDAWDIERGGIAIEFDEAQHFNPLRRLTLDSVIYTRPFPLTEYKAWCDDRKCITRCVNKPKGFFGFKRDAGKEPVLWSQFGRPRPAWSEVKDLRRASKASGNVSWITRSNLPRLKQRAFYDFVKDIYPYLRPGEIALARISIYDEVKIDGKPVKVEEALDDPPRSHAAPFWNLIKTRIVRGPSS